MSGRDRASCVAAGLLAGAAGGLFGVGGGIVLIPMLTGWLRATQHQAHGTSLAVIGATAITSIPIYALHGNVAWTTALGIAVSSVVFAQIGARLATRLSPHQLRVVFVVFLVIVAVRLLAGPLPGSGVGSWHHGVMGVAFDLGLGAVVGTMSGFMGVGGGMVIVPALTLLTGMAQQLAQGTSLAVILVSAPSGALEHSRHGNVLWRLVPWLAIGAAAGGIAASMVVQGLPRAALARGFALFLLANAASLGWKAMRTR